MLRRHYRVDLRGGSLLGPLRGLCPGPCSPGHMPGVT